MMLLCHNMFAGRRNAVTVTTDRVTIGRGSHNSVVLENPLIANEAAVLDRIDQRWRVSVLGNNGCKVDGRTLHYGDEFYLEPEHSLEIFPFQIQFESGPKANGDPEHERLMNESFGFIHSIHRDLLNRMNLQSETASQHANPEYLVHVEHQIEQLAIESHLADEDRRPLTTVIAGESIRQLLIESVLKNTESKSLLQNSSEGWRRLVTVVQHREQELDELVDQLREELELDEIDDISEQMLRIDELFQSAWNAMHPKLLWDVLVYMTLRCIKKQVKDIVFGYGPLEDLLRIPTISEIMVVDSNHIFVEKSGVIENSGRRFISDDVSLTIIDRIVSRVGRRIDKSQPLVDARLMDGSRVNAVIPPLAVSGPSITIRKFPLNRLQMADLVRAEALSESVGEFLRACVIAKCNILISGGTGTGKTTLLNCLADFIPLKERIVTIEDTAELQIPREHVVRMEAKPANAEGMGAYTIRDLVKNSLRMRPDRIIIGECRGGESIDMLQAMNTGHEGSLTTIHANNPHDVQLRLEVMVQSAVALPVDSIHRQMASAIDIIVQLNRFRDGRRRVTKVVEVAGLTEGGPSGVRLKELFSMTEGDDNSPLVPTGYLPSFIERLLSVGYDLDNFYC